MTQALAQAQDNNLYILEPNVHYGREKDARPYPLYSELHTTNRSWYVSPHNWNNSSCFNEAFKSVQTRTQMGETLRRRQDHENTMFFHGKPLAAHSMHTVPDTLKLIDLKRDADIIAARTLAANPALAGWIKDALAQLLIGRSFGNHDEAVHVGNEFTLRNLHAIAGDAFTVTVAGPNWEAIADNNFMKMSRADQKPVKELFQTHFPEDKLPAAINWMAHSDEHWSSVMGLVHTHWPCFAEDYDGYSRDCGNYGPYRAVVAESFRKHAQRIGSALEVGQAWDAVDAVSRMEGMGDFGRRFGDTFMRLKNQEAEMYEREQAARIWLKPGQWIEAEPPKPRLNPWVPRLG